MFARQEPTKQLLANVSLDPRGGAQPSAWKYCPQLFRRVQFTQQGKNADKELAAGFIDAERLALVVEAIDAYG